MKQIASRFMATILEGSVFRVFKVTVTALDLHPEDAPVTDSFPQLSKAR